MSVEEANSQAGMRELLLSCKYIFAASWNVFSNVVKTLGKLAFNKFVDLEIMLFMQVLLAAIAKFLEASGGGSNVDTWEYIDLVD